MKDDLYHETYLLHLVEKKALLNFFWNKLRNFVPSILRSCWVFWEYVGKMRALGVLVALKFCKKLNFWADVLFNIFFDGASFLT
jgi:hypothetical protein